MTSEYQAAIEKHNEAVQIFKSAQMAYRNRQTNDTEFLAAKASFDLATKDFDAAFQKESLLPTDSGFGYSEPCYMAETNAHITAYYQCHPGEQSHTTAKETI